MTKHIYKFIILSLGISLLACEDPFDVQLDQAEESLVVDAYINNLVETQTIKLTIAQNYFNSDVAAGVEGASVVVSSTNGRSFTFTETSEGVYQWTPADASDNLGNIGDDYTLNIEFDGDQYQATSTLNPVPPIDSITWEERDDIFFDGIFTEFFARDLPGIGNTYWIKTFKNGQFLNKPTEINIAYDAGFDSGAEIDNIIFIPPIRFLTNEIADSTDFTAPYDLGDHIRVEIHSLNLEVFSFMETARDQIINGDNGIFAEPLANSTGNISHVNGEKEVLGAFCVSAISSLEATIE